MRSSFFKSNFVPVKTAQSVLEVQPSDAQEVEVYFSKLAFCATFNGASLQAA